MWVSRGTASLAAAFLVSGCAGNSLPAVQGFTRPDLAECPPARICNSAHVLHAFADANGTLYPSGWRDRIVAARIRRAHSLYNATSPGSADRDFIALGEEKVLAEIAALQREGGRIFILVHGYNNKVGEADDAFDPLEAKLDVRPQDRIIRFYWDGLTGKGVGAARIWFRAVANSQLVGSRALRRILNQFQDRDIYLIGHSRGTSVILSALGNPVYDPRFLRKTTRLATLWGFDPEDFVHPPALQLNRNRIRILVAAPAVDRIDFCSADAQPLVTKWGLSCPTEQLRPLPVESFRYTINTKDPVLNKFVGLSAYFNPTGLGLGKEVGPPLRCHYKPRMRAHIVPPKRVHTFKWYIGQDAFDAMLAAEGIGKSAGSTVASDGTGC